MEAFRELLVQILAIIFGGISLASRIPKWLRSKSIEGPIREDPPECLFDPLLGRHRFVKINGTKYHYIENGSRSKEMILCLHDFGDFWYGWRNQLIGLSHSNWVVALDLKGFGDSEKPFITSKYKDEVVVQELKKFIDVLQEDDRKIVLIGHGLGGHIAWKFVEKYPSMVSKFISISTPHPRIWLKHVMRSWRSVIENRWLYACRLPFLPEMEMVTNDLEVFDNRFKKSSSVTDLTNYSNFDKEAYKYTFSRTTDWQGPINYFRNLPLADSSVLKEEGPKKCIHVETLLLVGNMDTEVSLDLVSQCSEYADRFATQIVNGAGHIPHQEQPDFVNKLVAKFIEGTNSPVNGKEKGDQTANIFQSQKSRQDLMNSFTQSNGTPCQNGRSVLNESNTNVYSKNHSSKNNISMNTAKDTQSNGSPCQNGRSALNEPNMNDVYSTNHSGKNNISMDRAKDSSNKIIQKITNEPNNNEANYIDTTENKIIPERTYVNKVTEYGSNIMNSYKDRALESSSNLLSSGISSITNRVTNFPVVEQYVPWLSEENQ